MVNSQGSTRKNIQQSMLNPQFSKEEMFDNQRSIFKDKFVGDSQMFERNPPPAPSREGMWKTPLRECSISYGLLKEEPFSAILAEELFSALLAEEPFHPSSQRSLFIPSWEGQGVGTAGTTEL